MFVVLDVVIQLSFTNKLNCLMTCNDDLRLTIILLSVVICHIILNLPQNICTILVSISPNNFYANQES